MKTHAIILAAGRGTRLKLENTPKALVVVNHKPLIFHILETLNQIEAIDDITVVVNHMAETVKQAVNKEFKGINFFTQEPLDGTGGAVMQIINANEFASEDTLLVMQADDSWRYTVEDFQKLLAVNTDKFGLFVTSSSEDKYNYYRKVLVNNIGEFIELTKEPQLKGLLVCGAYIGKQNLYKKYLEMLGADEKGEIGLPFLLYKIDPKLVTVVEIDETHWHGINTKEELADANS